MVSVVEQVSVFTPLGIRLWDPVIDKQIRNEMRVTAYPLHLPSSKTFAYKTQSDIFAFSHLAGMRSLEYDLSDGSTSGSPADKHTFIVEIHDNLRRYISVALRIELPLPYRGIFLSDEPTSSPDIQRPKGVYLYSSPLRSVPGWMTKVHGELTENTTGQPAAHAVLRVTALSGEEWYGIADAQGRYSIVLPYPKLPGGFSASPLSPGQKSLFEQSWDLDMEVFYSPHTVENLPFSSIPSYLSVLRQDAALIWAEAEDEGGVAVTSLPIVLEYNKTTNPRTDGKTSLLINPTVS